MEISASDVKHLRDLTGAGMMDCKKALTEANGDMDAAVEYLRKKGQKVSDQRADRDANQGVVVTLISDDKKKAVALELNCETDFVARNEDFIATANGFAKTAFDNNLSDADALRAASWNGLAISEHLKAMVGKIGEKIDIRRVVLLQTEGAILSYIHPGNALAVLVDFKGAVSDDIGKDVAMQIAAMNPIAVRKEEVDATLLEKELEIAKEQLINEGKPVEIAEKAAHGKLRRFYEERVLLEQKFVKDGGITVREYLANSKAPDVNRFTRVQLGVE
jgi:elongation factor Ts